MTPVARPTPQFVERRITAPRGLGLTLLAVIVGACMPGAAATISPIPAEALRVTLGAPAQAVAGQPLRYTALLANPGTTPIRLTPCPTYQERLNAPGGSVVREYVLNCTAAPVMAPGERVAFAMVLDVPVSLPPTSDAALVWILDPFHSEGFPPAGPVVKVPLAVVAPASAGSGSGTTGP